MNEEEFDDSDIPMGIAPGACWDEPADRYGRECWRRASCQSEQLTCRARRVWVTWDIGGGARERS